MRNEDDFDFIMDLSLGIHSSSDDAESETAERKGREVQDQGPKQSSNILRDLLCSSRLKESEPNHDSVPKKRLPNTRDDPYSSSGPLTPPTDDKEVMEVTEVKMEPPDSPTGGDDDPWIMNTAEDARQFWDEMVAKINDDPRCTGTFRQAHEVASQRSITAVTEQLNSFIGETEKIRSVGPEFISKFVLMFHGFINLWRKESNLPPLVNVDGNVKVSSPEEKDLTWSSTIEERQDESNQESYSYRTKFPPLKGSYNFRQSNELRKILPKDGAMLEFGVKRGHDGSERIASAPTQRILRPKAVGIIRHLLTMPLSAVNRKQVASTEEGVVTTKTSGILSTVSRPITTSQTSSLPTSSVPLFLRLPNGHFAPVTPASVQSSSALVPAGIKSIPKFDTNESRLNDSGIVYKPVVNQLLQQALDRSDNESRARLILPKLSSSTVTPSFPEMRCTPSPAKKLARIAPAPSRESGSPILNHSNQSESNLFEADISISRALQDSFFRTTVTVDKANGQGCISDINKRCQGGKISLRCLCNLGNFDDVKIEDLILSFDENSEDSTVQLKLKFRKA